MPRFVCESARKIFHVGGENGILFARMKKFCYFYFGWHDWKLPCPMLWNNMPQISCLKNMCWGYSISYHAIKNTVNKKKCSWKLDPICPLYGKSGMTPSTGGWVIGWFTYNTIAISLLFLHSLTQNTETHQQVFYVIHRFGITLT